MSIKHQRTLLISAVIIIAVTGVGLVFLNYAVDKISQINPPSIATAAKPHATIASEDMAVIDNGASGAKKPVMDLQQRGMMPPFDGQAHPPRMPNRGGIAPPFDGQGRIRNGKDAHDLRRLKQPSGPPVPDRPGQGQGPPPRDMMDMRNMGNGPNMMQPPPDFMRMSPAERERLQREMMEEQNEQYGPPWGPGGYPPNFPQAFPPGFGGPPGYDDSYDGDFDFEGGPFGARNSRPPDDRGGVKLSNYIEDSADDEDVDGGLDDDWLDEED